MLQGRWYSNNFLGYIRKQGKELSKDVRAKMLGKQAYKFFTIPDFEFDNNKDPKIPGNPNSLTCSFDYGSTASAFIRNHSLHGDLATKTTFAERQTMSAKWREEEVIIGIRSQLFSSL